jgi:hypothetical protein
LAGGGILKFHIGDRVRINDYYPLFKSSTGVVVNFLRKNGCEWERVQVKVDQLHRSWLFQKEGLELIDSSPIPWQKFGF